MKTISFEQLAEKLNGKIWTKGDLKRIYLDAGYNTKKMSTKTYVEESNGQYVVKCFIECPSQGWNWIKSQQDEVIKSVENQITEILASEVYLITNEAGEIVNGDAVVTPINDLFGSDYFFTQSDVEERIENIFRNKGLSFKTMDKDEFNAEVVRLDDIHREKVLAVRAARPKVEEKKAIPVPPAENTDNPEFGVDSKVKHSNFGIGTVTSESNEKITIDFPGIGEKSLIKRFAKLVPVNG